MNVFWSRCGHGHGNFGDKLTPLFLDYLNIPYQWAPPKQADLIGIGSLMEKIPDDFKGVIWSTGNMFGQTSKSLRSAQVLAVRGKLTLERVNCLCLGNIALGDGGLLADLFHQPTRKKFKLGLIPHFADQQHPTITKVAGNNSQTTLIDICAPTLDVIQRVGECEYVLSSSLHGLVLADSLGVANQWIELGQNSVSGAGFKFRDYYSNFGLEHIRPVQLRGDETLETILSIFDDYQRPNLATVKAALLRSLDRLAQCFGAKNGRRSLDQLRQREQIAKEEREAWNEELRSVLLLLKENIPARTRFVLIDDEQLRSEITHGIPVPLIEQDGEYWGVPENDEHAVTALKRHLACGIEHVVVAACSFWWLDSYPLLAEFLSRRLTCCCATPHIRVFRTNR